MKKPTKRNTVYDRADGMKRASSGSPEKVYYQHTATSEHGIVQVSLIVQVAFVIYLNALFGDFVADDVMQVADNTGIRHIGNIPAIFFSDVWHFLGKEIISNYYRPLMYVTYMITYLVFGLKPWGFHLVNIFFHCGVSVLIFLLTARLVPQEKGTKSPAYLSSPFLAAIAFAAHPVHAEAVTWIACLPEVAFAFFYLLSFYSYVKGPSVRSTGYRMSVVYFAVAIFYKEPALTLPLLMLVYDFLWVRKAGTRIEVKKYLPYVFVGAIYIILRVIAIGKFAPVQRHAQLGFTGYVINIFPLLADYLQKLFFPVHLSAFYVFHPIASLFETRGIVSLIAVLLFAAAVFFSYRRSRPVFFGLVMFIFTLLPALYIPALGENTFAERYLYLPSAGFAIIFAIYLSWAKKKRPDSAKGMTAVILIVLGLYMAGTVSRNTVWKNNVSLWSDTIRQSPDSAVAHHNLGMAYKAGGSYNPAIEQFRAALRLKPDVLASHYNLGLVYEARHEYDRAVEQYLEVLKIMPDFAEAHINLGDIYGNSGQPDLAMQHFNEAIKIKPDLAEPHFNLGLLYRSRNEIKAAKKEIVAGLALKPDDQRARELLVEIDAKMKSGQQRIP